MVVKAECARVSMVALTYGCFFRIAEAANMTEENGVWSPFQQCRGHYGYCNRASVQLETLIPELLPRPLYPMAEVNWDRKELF
jgi:hypothetical protein